MVSIQLLYRVGRIDLIILNNHNTKSINNVN